MHRPPPPTPHRQGFLAYLIAFILVLVAGTPRPSELQAATLNVDTTVDDAALTACDDAAPNDCSLRGAILAANARPASEATTINAPAGTYVLTQPNHCYFSTTQFGAGLIQNTTALCVSGKITLVGAHADTTIIDGDLTGQIIFVGNTAPVEIRKLTLKRGKQQGGSYLGFGGAINNASTLTVADCLFTNNTSIYGGAIYNSKTLHVLRSTFALNAASQNGGALYNDSNNVQTTMSVTDSVIDNNVAYQGGGISNYRGFLTITNTTISNNSSGLQGGGIVNWGSPNFLSSLTITNSTLSGNQAFWCCGGGLYNGFSSTTHLYNVTVANNSSESEDGTRGGGGGVANTEGGALMLRNTIIAGNTAPEFAPDCYDGGRASTLTSEGYNLIQNQGPVLSGGTTDCDLSGDHTGNLIGVDAKLGVLADNGGPTQTHALLADSPAIDAGNPNGCTDAEGNVLTRDQRGEPRALDGNGDDIARCDIGAFESSVGFFLSDLRPAKAGNAGPVGAALYGAGFQTGAAVKLTRTGESDIVGSQVAVGGGGSVLTTSFDLTGATPGVWNVVVTNPDATSITRAAAFTVEQGGAAQVWADIVGPPNIRIGFPARFKIFFGNRGTSDALGTPLVLGIPKDFTFNLSFPLAPPPSQPGQTPTDWGNVAFTEVSHQRPDFTIIPLLLPVVPAGFTGVLEFFVTAPGELHGQPFQILFDISPPYFKPNLDPQIISELTAGARKYAKDHLGVVIPPELIPDLERYLTTQLQSEVAHGREAWVTSVGAQLEIYNQAHLLIDLAQFGVAQTALQMSQAQPRPLEERVSLSGLLTSGFQWLIAALLEPRAAQAQTCSREEGMEWQRCGKCVQPVCCQIGRNCCFSFSCPKPPPPDCTGSACSPGPGSGGGITGSIDPNDKVGSRGAGTAQYITGAEPLRYVIFFENLATATAPAQTVDITDTLDTATLDLSTFSLGPIGFNLTTIVPPPGLSIFTTEVDLRPAQDLGVRVDAALDKNTGELSWRFTSIDPTTGEPLDPSDLRGFLPPNVSPPEGDGSVTFTVNPKAGLATGAEIRNQAHIVFDVNPPIDTPQWLNTIDNTKPQSAVMTARASVCSQEIQVQWSGSDVGAGIATYNLFVSEDGGPFIPWLSDTPDTARTFIGKWGKQYGFYSVARDKTGNVEDTPGGPDTMVTVTDCGPHDLAVTKITAPRIVALTSERPRQTKLVKVQIQNRSPRPETIADEFTLQNLVTLRLDALGSCPALSPELLTDKPQKTLPLTLKPKQKLNVIFAVSFACSSATKGVADYRLNAQVHQSALGGADAHPEDDACPRNVAPPFAVDPYPDGTLKDKGCGEKKADKTLGDPVLVDVVSK